MRGLQEELQREGGELGERKWEREDRNGWERIDEERKRKGG